MTDRALLEQILSNQETILEALKRQGMIPTVKQEESRELSEVDRLAVLFRADRAAYRAEMKKRARRAA